MKFTFYFADGMTSVLEGTNSKDVMKAFSIQEEKVSIITDESTEDTYVFESGKWVLEEKEVTEVTE